MAMKRWPVEREGVREAVGEERVKGRRVRREKERKWERWERGVSFGNGSKGLYYRERVRHHHGSTVK